ncbi:MULTISPECIES: hypothetical protein [unclassified Bradyrhizobium]|uniref:hypothetical protein n=1 Tax=unclassified Bradyrhizobium TaxID=2631580 RepID=UPI0028E4B61F|nr:MULTISPECIES: hypothetical protein [unclassified Bradyrhizobium]
MMKTFRSVSISRIPGLILSRPIAATMVSATEPIQAASLRRTLVDIVISAPSPLV